MKILITGGNGQLAFDLKNKLQNRNINFIALSHKEFDITDAKKIYSLLKEYQPTFIINTAAYTQVDQAEEEKELAYAINCEGAKNLAQTCEHFDIPLFHLSTDYVFAGNKLSSYSETDFPNPLNHYGKSKLAGEREIIKNCEKNIILRVSAVYGVHGNNFVKTILRLSKEKEILRIVDDQFTCQTAAADIADTIIRMLNNPSWGIYHFCSDKSLSWYAFAVNIIKKARSFEKLKLQTIEAIKTSEYNAKAKRPLNSILNCEKIYSHFNISQTDSEKGLSNVITKLYSA